MAKSEKTARGFSLGNKKHLETFVNLLCITGALCPKCGWGTRRTSKRWGRCKKCGERVERHELSEIRVAAQGPGGEGNDA